MGEPARIGVLPANLPAERTSFVGRKADLARAREALAASRLCTITGPPGIGKTRLARRHAAQRADAVAVCFCDLTETRTAEDVVHALAGALAVPLLGDDPAAQLARALAARGPLLAVLDNFEQVAAHAAPTVGRWLDLCPEARFLVTSRERLRIEGEICVELDPLPAEDAVRLFQERALAVRARRLDGPDDRTAVLDLVERLDGIPLAIELAAARIAQLTPETLLARLGRRFDLLKSDRRDARARQATLRAAIDWSWDLLTARERDVLSRASVFRGGFSLEAAAEVLGPTDTGRPIEDVLAALCDKSVLDARESAELPGEPRFRVLESIREYAAEKLDASEMRPGAERRHTMWALRAAEHWAEGADGPEAADCLRRLAVERDNVVAVHRREADRSPVVAIRAALAIDRLLRLRGPLDLQIELLDRAVGSGDDVPDLLRARALLARAAARAVRGARADAEVDLDRALALCGGDGEVRADVLRSLGRLDRARGDVARARDRLGASIALSHDGGDSLREALAQGELGVLLATQRTAREVDEGERLLRAAVGAHEAAGERVALPVLLGSLSLVLSLRWKWDEARRTLENALALHRENGNLRDEAIAVTHLGFLLLNAWPDEADPVLERAHALACAVGHQVFEADAAWGLGMRAVETGRYGDAEKLLARAAELIVPMQRANAICWLGVLRHAEGRMDDARERFDEALRLAREFGQRFREAMVRAHEGALLAEIGLEAQARESFAAARAIAAELSDPTLGTTIDVLARFLDPSDEPVPTSTGINGRVCARILLAARERHVVAAAGAGIEIGPDGRWLRVLGGKRVDLVRRGAVRRVLCALVSRRESAPGGALSLDEVLAAGWPGEKVRFDAGSKRVHTAIWTLRKLGLEGLVVTRDDGYLLDPAVPVRRG